MAPTRYKIIFEVFGVVKLWINLDGCSMQFGRTKTEKELTKKGCC